MVVAGNLPGGTIAQSVSQSVSQSINKQINDYILLYLPHPIRTEEFSAEYEFEDTDGVDINPGVENADLPVSGVAELLLPVAPAR